MKQTPIMTATTPLPPPSSSSSSFISTSTSTSTSASTATSISTHLHLYLHSQPSTREPVPFTLTPPELFAIITDTPPSPIYRCSRLTLENLPFLKTFLTPPPPPTMPIT
ncbi:hypothetical protein L873DRAFT_943993 [Choiromyces venosus 120613-1]|uniref:Uncharacterized protein n=1 Tax=Choiromyces venosus 120613-1 TaxID=1336337 RepID=A0A3N4K3E2_9PEZI|nr:hypothetical protein L873DRAFT_943993 [Choiromyces venosus 120613-1]